jgi:hypothetical protein
MRFAHTLVGERDKQTHRRRSLVAITVHKAGVTSVEKFVTRIVSAFLQLRRHIREFQFC